VWVWSTFWHYLVSQYLLVGAAVTLGLSLGAIALGLVCGLVAALMRMSRSPFLNQPAAFYIWLMRGTPVLVQLIIIYTGLPQIGIKLGVITSAVVGLGLNEGAYLAEIIRAGISSVPRGQLEAARAVGMTIPAAMRIVILPQAMRIIIPPLGNSFNGLMKTTSLASVISMEELLRRTELLIQVQFKVLEIFSVAALYYLALTTIWGFVQKRLEERFSRGFAPYHGSGRRTLLSDAEAAKLEQVSLSHDGQ
jgi:polar amino acid transport system permease protein